MHVRPLRHPDDLKDLQHLFEECRVADGHAPIGEHQYLHLIGATPGRLIGRMFEVGNDLVGYLHLNQGRDDGWVLETAIHPDYREPGVVREVLESAVELVVHAGGGPVRVWGYHPMVAEMAEELGFHSERHLLQMRLPLPPGHAATPPVGLRLMPFQMGDDEERWIELNNRAFVGHPENGSWTRIMLADRMRQDWFDPDGLLMAWRGSMLAGFCWTKLHPGALGEIYVIAVAPAFQGRSLGRWLTLEGLWYLAQNRKARTAMLYVDAANRRAVGMYQRLGFELDHVDRSFVRVV